MADESVEIVAMGDSSGDGEEKFEIYEARSDMFCVIGLENSKQATAKSSGSKSRYKQCYREAWESMRDFKGWLTSVPGNTSKAYCKLCQKELHCHRLSLLKHKVTFKHQKKEEEQISTHCGEKNENHCITKLREQQMKESYGNAKSALLEMVDSNSDLDESIMSKAATSESCNTLPEKAEGVNSQNGCLSTHVLDISKGVPAASVQVVVYKLIEGRWTLIHEGLTNSDGRYSYSVGNNDEFSEGRYKLHFDVDKYFEKHNQSTIFPFIEIVFNVKEVSSKYHIPLLLSPYGYSTYKGS